MTKLTLPSGWVITNFGELVVSMSNGYNGTQNKDGIGIPVSRIETIANEFINFNKIGFISKYDDAKIAKYRLKKGEILFSHINSPSHLGKTAIFNSDKKLYHGINLLRMIVEKKIIYPEIFNFYCKFSRSLGNFSLIAQHAVNQSSLNQKKLKIFNIILPPLNEQQRIANKLDQLLAQVDSIKSHIDNIPKILKRFRQSVLNAAVTGKLTEKWRKKHETSWTKKLLGDLIFSASNGLSKRNGNEGEYVTILRLADFKNAKRINGNERSIKLNTQEIEKYRLLKGDILVIRVNGSVELAGKFIEYDIINNLEGFCDHFIRLKLNHNKLLPTYLKFVANEGKGRNYLKNSLSTSAGQNTINQKSVNNLEILLPPLEEQTEIVKRVESLFAFSDQVEQRVKDAQARINNLTQSILAKAFRGELVPQDPNDEPASELLKRIQQERQQAAVLAKAAKKSYNKN